MTLVEVHGAIEEGNQGGHQEAGQVVSGAAPVHDPPFLHQLKHLHCNHYADACCTIYHSLITSVTISSICLPLRQLVYSNEPYQFKTIRITAAKHFETLGGVT